MKIEAFLDDIEGLLVAAQNGDKRAENQLFSQIRARVYQIVQRRIWNSQMHASEIKQDAEDLTAEICLTIVEAYKTIHFEIGFMPWVCRITWNKIGQYYRERERKQKVEGANLEEAKFRIANGLNDTERQIEYKELDSFISQALKKMRHRCREIIAKLLQGRIKEYILEKQKAMPPGTIYSHINRCRSRFKHLLQLQGFEL